MINQNITFENTENQFAIAFKELKLGKLLNKSGIRKAQGASAYSVFQFLLLLVFQGKNLFRFLSSKHKEEAFSKNTYYRFLNESKYNWRKFLCLLAVTVTGYFSTLTRPERVNVLVLDDSVVRRNRSKKVELLAKVYDHVFHRYIKGFTMLTLGWTDGYSFAPVDFDMLSSANEANRIQEASTDADKRTNGYKRRKAAISKKTEAAVQMVKNALATGIRADYVLMDTWFTTEPMICSILKLGIDVIGMVKQMNQKYIYDGQEYTLPELRKFLRYESYKNILGSIVVSTKAEGVKVKIVFVRNRNKKSEWLYVLSTDVSLSDAEVIRIYGNRWSIEVFFKASKSLMKLENEFQGRSYDMMVSHTTIVFTRYIILEWIRRSKNDEKTFGELFYLFCDDIQDMDLTTALQSLMALLVEHINTVAANITEIVKSKLQLWMSSQASFIQALFANISWES
jgi:hypothetical protein